MRTLSILFSVVTLASVAGAAFVGQDRSSTEPGQEPKAPERQFDFWIGHWDCFGTDGQLSGTNDIELLHDGRVLQEDWKGIGGSTGTSVNLYDAVTKRWHQTWVDNSGTLLQLDGGLTEEGAMRLEGKRPGRDGGEVLHRVTWTPNGANVQQTWVMSADEGESWTTLADLEYRPREAKEE